jgi:hypothetical protein
MRRPWRSAASPGYVSPPGWKQECLGRQIFDVPGEIEWGMADPKTPYYPSAKLSPRLAVQSDIWRYGYDNGDADDQPFIIVSITPKGDKAVFEDAKQYERAEIRNAFFWQEERLRTNKRILARNVDEQFLSPEGVQDYENEVKDIELSLEELPKQHDVDLKLPDSYVSLYGGGTTVYLWRDSRVVRFRISHRTMPVPEQQKYLLDIIGRFRLREAHEIPSGPGVCLPHGFIADSGGVFYDIQNTFRLKDVPNVTYTLHVGDRMPDSEPFGPQIGLASRLTLPSPWGALVNPRIKERFGPENIKVGALPGLLAGYVIVPGLQDKSSQSVFTLKAGYEGETVANKEQLKTNRFPLVTFDVYSHSRQTDPTFTQPAPPVKAGKKRLLAIMKSMRWRGL